MKWPSNETLELMAQSAESPKWLKGDSDCREDAYTSCGLL